MLSRAAERVYWAGRYLERAENTARIVQQYSQLLLDLPDSVGIDWAELLAIFGHQPDTVDRVFTEREMLNLLLLDANSPSSLVFSIRMARRNVRNSRDLLPLESWESINELFQFVSGELDDIAVMENRFETLALCIGRCQQVAGALGGTMSDHEPLKFLTLGQSIERADMTSRIIDVAATYLQGNERLVRRYGSTLWTNSLKSVSGFQMYRQYVRPEVQGMSVIQFLLNDTAFPRAVRACAERARGIGVALPRNEPLLQAIDELESVLPSREAGRIDGTGISALMDELQRGLANIHQAVVDVWFLPARDS